MYKLIVQTLSKSSHNIDPLVTRNVAESTLMRDLLNSINIDNKAAIGKFINDIPKTDSLHKSLKPILLDNENSTRLIEKLESELSKSMPKLAFKRRTAHPLLKGLDDDLAAEDIQTTIDKNNKLKSLSDKFISIVKKNKLSLSAIALTSATVGAYLYDSASNLSGCYKISEVDGVSIECKVKPCCNNSKPNINYCNSNSSNKSLNDKFCNGVCYPDGKSCDEARCKAVLTSVTPDTTTKATLTTTTTIDTLNTPPTSNLAEYKSPYSCINVKWYQVLGHVINEFGSDLKQTLFKVAKYLLVLLVGLVTFNVMSNYDWKYRLGISSVNMLAIGLIVSV